MIVDEHEWFKSGSLGTKRSNRPERTTCVDVQRLKTKENETKSERTSTTATSTTAVVKQSTIIHLAVRS